MIHSVTAPKKKRVSVASSKTNGARKDSEKASIPRFHRGLGDHPFWQEYVEALEASRQADIAEANRQADLEELESKK